MTEKNIRQVPELEKVFGDFEPGRFMWILKEVKMLKKPIPAKEKQRIWEFNGERFKLLLKKNPTN